jgi:hypothetical protein
MRFKRAHTEAGQLLWPRRSDENLGGTELLGREVDLHQGNQVFNASMVVVIDSFKPQTKVVMPPLSKFKKFDVRALLEKGLEPLPEILKRVQSLKPDQGLIVVAPFLPSPLIEKLGSEGFQSKVEPAQGGPWIVYFWRESRSNAVA